MNHIKQQYLNLFKVLKYLLLLLIVTIISCKSEDTLQLITNGVSNYEIVFNGEANESEYKATEVLKTYIDKISNANIPIVDESSQNSQLKKIYVGNFSKESLIADELLIKVENDNLYISGGSDLAIQNAVYRVSRKLFKL